MKWRCWSENPDRTSSRKSPPLTLQRRQETCSSLEQTQTLARLRNDALEAAHATWRGAGTRGPVLRLCTSARLRAGLWGFRGNTNLAGVERLGDRVLVAPFDGARQDVLCRSVLNPAQHGGFGGDPLAPDLPSRQFALRKSGDTVRSAAVIFISGGFFSGESAEWRFLPFGLMGHLARSGERVKPSRSDRAAARSPKGERG
jgi:hypothetical protein